MGLPSERIAVNHSYNTLCICSKLDHFSVFYIKRSFALSLVAIKDSNWIFLILYIVDGWPSNVNQTSAFVSFKAP